MFVGKQTLQRLLTGPASMRSMQVASAKATPLMRPAMLAATASRRNFSDINDGAKKLTRALEKEIKYENENYVQMDDIATFLSESGFKFDEEQDGIFMSLKKQVGNKVVEVTFEAR